MQHPQQCQYCFLNVRETGRAIDYCDGNGDREDRRPVAQIVSDLGRQGWELVSVVNFTPMDLFIRYCFKCPAVRQLSFILTQDS